MMAWRIACSCEGAAMLLLALAAILPAALGGTCTLPSTFNAGGDGCVGGVIESWLSGSHAASDLSCWYSN